MGQWTRVENNDEVFLRVTNHTGQVNFSLLVWYGSSLGETPHHYVYILNCSFLQVQCLHWWSQLSWFDQHLMQVMFLDFFRFWNWVLYRRVFKALSASQNRIKAVHCWILVVSRAWCIKENQTSAHRLGHFIHYVTSPIIYIQRLVWWPMFLHRRWWSYFPKKCLKRYTHCQIWNKLISGVNLLRSRLNKISTPLCWIKSSGIIAGGKMLKCTLAP